MAGLMFEPKVKGQRWLRCEQDYHRGRVNCPGCSMRVFILWGGPECLRWLNDTVVVEREGCFRRRRRRRPCASPLFLSATVLAGQWQMV